VSAEKLWFDRARFEALLQAIEYIAGGDLEHQMPISPQRDELDALSHAVNVLSRELLFRLRELETAQSSLIQSGKLAALGELTSGLAHELNNPLTIIAGYLELIHGSIQDRNTTPVDFPELELHLQKVERNVERMNVIIRHFIEFARGSKPIKKPTELNDVIEKSFILMNEQLRLKKIHIEKDLCNDAVAQIDGSGMEQVFINLLSNARDAIIEAHGEAGGTINVRLKILSKSEVEIEISDNGTGISDEIRSKIFNPFFTTKQVGNGTGLGLSISHRIVQDHGGTIDCISEPGKGTAFRIRLPRCHPMSAPAAHE
jgi:signal transduction histidine kinase